MEFKSVENNYSNNGYNGGNRYQSDNYRPSNYGPSNFSRQNNYQDRVKKEPPKDAYTIYTDGGCIMRENPPIGAWAFVDPQTGYKDCDAEENTTNNKMELTAAIKALEYLIAKKNEGLDKPFMIKSDSMYVVKGSAFWIKKWKKNNWKRIDKDGNVVGDVLNVEYWKRIDELTSQINVWWSHVDGHSGDTYNDMCDEMVKEAMRRFRTN